ncbi:LpxA family transferase [Kaistella carnis]|uniref:LpxA family transferase n=1 Tax=Kaistella carnis TaxID=1241979 RepID=UPI0028A183C8|nr:LpxA family transferase [Kaistella carnis]
MIPIEDFIENFYENISKFTKLNPWEITNDLEKILNNLINQLSSDFIVTGNIAVHKNAEIEKGAILKGTIIVDENSRIGSYAYLRGPILIGKSVNIGPSTEIKQSIILNDSAIAHFNYIGNSIIGNNVNFEAGSICANHFNEKDDKNILVKYNGELISTNSNKFGSLVGDYSRIGANAVLSPGTILEKKSIVKRLELIEQVK